MDLAFANQLEAAYGTKQEVMWQTRHKMKGIIGTSVNSNTAQYFVDWSSFSQVNKKTKKTRPLRRVVDGVVTHGLNAEVTSWTPVTHDIHKNDSPYHTRTIVIPH